MTCCAIFNNSLSLHCSQVLLHFTDILASVYKKNQSSTKGIYSGGIYCNTAVCNGVHTHTCLVTIIYSKLGLFDNTCGRLPSTLANVAGRG